MEEKEVGEREEFCKSFTRFGKEKRDKLEVRVTEAVETTAILEEIVRLRHQQTAALSEPQLRHERLSAFLKSSQVGDSSIKASYLTGFLPHDARARHQAPSLIYLYAARVAAAPDLREPWHAEGFPMAMRHVVIQSEKRSSLKPRTKTMDEYTAFALPGARAGRPWQEAESL